MTKLGKQSKLLIKRLNKKKVLKENVDITLIKHEEKGIVKIVN